MRIRALVTTGLLALFTTATAGAQAPWTVTIRQSANPLPIGTCHSVSLTVFDPVTKGNATNALGGYVSAADFDMSADSDEKPAAVGKYEGTAWSVCGCQSATVGQRGTITATYPARSIKESLLVSGVAFKTQVPFTFAEPQSKYNAPGCDALTTAVSTGASSGGASSGAGAGGAAAAGAAGGAGGAAGGAAPGSGSASAGSASAGAAGAAGAAGSTSAGATGAVGASGAGGTAAGGAAAGAATGGASTGGAATSAKTAAAGVSAGGAAAAGGAATAGGAASASGAVGSAASGGAAAGGAATGGGAATSGAATSGGTTAAGGASAAGSASGAGGAAAAGAAAVPVPQNVRLVPGESRLAQVLAWDRLPGVTGYNVSIKLNATVTNWTLITSRPLRSESFTDSATRQPGTIYRVTALYADGRQGSTDFIVTKTPNP